MVQQILAFYCSSKYHLLGLLFSFYVSSSVLKAQNVYEGTFLNSGIGYHTELFYDAFYADFAYQTQNIIGKLGFTDQQGNWQNILNSTAGYGLGRARFEDRDFTLQNVPINVMYCLRYRLLGRVNHEHQLWAGLSNINTFNVRQNTAFSNSRVNVAGLFSYGLSANYQWQTASKNILKPEGEKVHWGLDFSLNLPVGSYVIRPGFTRQIENDDFGLTQHLFWSDFFHLNLKTGLVLGLANKNQVRLSYQWDYTQINKLNLYQQGQHQIIISTHFKF